MTDKLTKTDAEWAQELTPEQFRVMRQKGTEAPYTGEYWDTNEPGVYRCGGCGETLFDAGSKFDAGCGWPSFSAPAVPSNVETEEDTSYGMRRTEVHCARCDAHLGHLFDDGPAPTGLRYCINSASIRHDGE